MKSWNYCIILLALVFLSCIHVIISSCCDENSQFCEDVGIRSVVCNRNPSCCSGLWGNNCVELALIFACPKTCGDGICAMNREKAEDNEDCHSCPRDCGECITDNFYMKCSNNTIPIDEDPELKYQWHLSSSHTIKAWKDFTLFGDNITIAIVDDGIQWQHPDLQCNYQDNLSYDIDRDQKTVYAWQNDNHGTSCAGLIGARDNSICGRGAAFRSNIVGIRTLGNFFSDANAARSISWERDNIDIYSNSWGPSDNGATIERYPLTMLAIKNGVNFGRSGLGNIFVWAGGNGRLVGDVSNYDELCNSIFTICVGASDGEGVFSSYSEPGANILINGPSNNIVSGVSRYGIVTTDRMGFPGYQAADCNRKFGGTSAAAPLVAGILGLLLQSNPALTWRDMQHVLVHSAERTDTQHSSWKKNAAGHYFSQNYGFGRINAVKGVEIAKEWKSLKETPRLYFSHIFNLAEYSHDGTSYVRIPEGVSMALELTIDIDTSMIIEHVAVSISTRNGLRGSIIVAVESPSGTLSVLATGRSRDYGSFSNFPFTSVEFWGEPSMISENGKWKVIIYDNSKDLITSDLTFLHLGLYGLPSANISTAMQIYEPSYLTNLLEASFMGKFPLLENKMNIYWSIDALYSELTFALEVINIENLGYISLSFPLSGGRFDTIVLYFDQNGIPHISDRISSSKYGETVTDVSQFGTEDIRLVYGTKTSKRQLFVIERSLNTQDIGNDAVFTKESQVTIYWAAGGIQENYDELDEPQFTGEASLKLLTIPPKKVNIEDLFIKWGIPIILMLVGMTLLGCVFVILAGSALFYIYVKRQLNEGDERHIELEEESEAPEQVTVDTSQKLENNAIGESEISTSG